jgi:AcrR family transcriptional regulator
MSVGRPRNFDYDEALDQALKVFWKKGYEGTTLPDLTAAMGINRPSMYAAFGNKEELFRKAIERYVAHFSAHFAEALKEPTARLVVEKLLCGGLNVVTNQDNPLGCFLVQGALACGDTADCLKQEVANRRRAGEELLTQRFIQAKETGDLPPQINAADLARYVFVLTYGMSVQANSGVSKNELMRIVEIGLRAFDQQVMSPH